MRVVAPFTLCCNTIGACHCSPTFVQTNALYKDYPLPEVTGSEAANLITSNILILVHSEAIPIFHFICLLF